jgi:hypothetical protein
MEQALTDKVAEANSRYNKDLERYMRGEMSRWQVFDLGDTFGNVSQYLGNGHLYMRQGVLTKAKKHNVSNETFRDLPLKLYHAPRIFKSTADNHIVVLINAKDMQNQPIVLPINTLARGYDGATPNKINEVASFYGKSPQILEQWADKQMELYNVAGKKTIGCSPRPSLILGERTTEVKKNLQMFGAIPNLEKNGGSNDTAKVVNNFEKPKPMEKNLQKGKEPVKIPTKGEVLDYLFGVNDQLNKQKQQLLAKNRIKDIFSADFADKWESLSGEWKKIQQEQGRLYEKMAKVTTNTAAEAEIKMPEASVARRMVQFNSELAKQRAAQAPQMGNGKLM